MQSELVEPVREQRDTGKHRVRCRLFVEVIVDNQNIIAVVHVAGHFLRGGEAYPTRLCDKCSHY